MVGPVLTARSGLTYSSRELAAPDKGGQEGASS